jgi:tetratricopeptide (TPR) repeat protein
LNQIAAKAHFIVILTPSALEGCKEPNDWLRKEVEHAIDLKRNIIPLTFGKYDMEDAKQHLTGKLALLAEYQALTVPSGYFDEAMTKLRGDRYLNRDVSLILHPTPLKDVAEVERKIQIADQLPTPTEEQLTAEQLFERANAHFAKGDIQNTITNLTEAIRLNPAFARAYNNRAVAQERIGNLEAAIEDYTQAIHYNSNYAIAFKNRGVAFFAKGDVSSAIADFNSSISIDPRNDLAYVNRGMLRCYEKGDFEGAIMDLTKAITLKPDFSPHYFDRGNMWRKNGNLDNAISDFSKAVKLNPTYALLYYARGELYFVQKDYKNALSDFRRAYELQPDNPPHIGGLAITYHVQKQVGKSLDLWRTLLDTDIRYKDADWVGKEFNWRPELVEEARKLIAKL